MRRLAVRLILWLSKRFDIVLINEQRIAMGGDQVARSQRWEAFAKEEGGLFDMIRAQREMAFEAYADTPPDDVATKEHLAMQDRALRQIEARVKSVIATGQIKAQQQRQEAVNQSPLRVI